MLKDEINLISKEHWEEVFEVFNDDYFPNDANGEEEYRIKLKQFIKNIISSRQISLIKMIVEHFEKGLGFNKGSMNDSLFQSLKSKLKELTDGK